MNLYDYAQGRDNNFNFIRLLAALSVIFSHSYPLAIGTEIVEPFRADLNITVGSMAVDVFFLTSGFLVAASLMTRQSALEFICARVLRIFPGLWAMLLVTVFLLGSALTTMSIRDYLTDGAVFAYFAKCATLVTGVSFYLPGIFETNPYGTGVNGSLWTLPFEIGMYGILLAAWMLLSIINIKRFDLFKITIVAFSVGSVLYLLVGYFRHGLPSEFELHRTYRFQSLFFMFFTGAAFYILRCRILLSSRLFVFFSIALFGSLVNKHAFYVVYLLALPYVLFYLAYIPKGRLREFNRLGDYSYGVYIYAFPIQQGIVYLANGVSPILLSVISVPITLFCAYLSWHLIEKRALCLKDSISKQILYFFRFGAEKA